MRSVVSIVAIVSIVWVWPLPAVAQTSSQPLVAPYTPLVWGWERFFKVMSEPEPVERKGEPYVTGYILNEWGFSARRVQLLVDGLDSSGRVVSQSVSWLGSSIPPGSRVYFEARAPRPAASYRVSVFAFDWLQTASVETP